MENTKKGVEAEDFQPQPLRIGCPIYGRYAEIVAVQRAQLPMVSFDPNRTVGYYDPRINGLSPYPPG